MEIEFDPDKDAENVRKHGLSFRDFAGFDEAPVAIEDERQDFGETRIRLFGRIAEKPYCLVVTPRGDVLRLISFRRAHEKEMRRHDR